jgi:hypothetical protein
MAASRKAAINAWLELRQSWEKASQPQQLVIFFCNAFRQPGGGNRGKPGQMALTSDPVTEA